MRLCGWHIVDRHVILERISTFAFESRTFAGKLNGLISDKQNQEIKRTLFACIAPEAVLGMKGSFLSLPLEENRHSFEKSVCFVRVK